MSRQEVDQQDSIHNKNQRFTAKKGETKNLKKKDKQFVTICHNLSPSNLSELDQIHFTKSERSY